MNLLEKTRSNFVIHKAEALMLGGSGGGIFASIASEPVNLINYHLFTFGNEFYISINTFIPIICTSIAIYGAYSAYKNRNK